MARTTGSHLICKALKLEGVNNIFGLAGDHILPVLDVMADQDFPHHRYPPRASRGAHGGRLEPDHRAAGCLHVHNAGLRQCDSRAHQCHAYRRRR